MGIWAQMVYVLFFKLYSRSFVEQEEWTLALTINNNNLCFQLMLSVTKIVVTLEGGVATQTVPLLITEMGFKAEVRDWSSQVHVIF